MTAQPPRALHASHFVSYYFERSRSETKESFPAGKKERACQLSSAGRLYGMQYLCGTFIAVYAVGDAVFLSQRSDAHTYYVIVAARTVAPRKQRASDGDSTWTYRVHQMGQCQGGPHSRQWDGPSIIFSGAPLHLTSEGGSIWNDHCPCHCPKGSESAVI